MPLDRSLWVEDKYAVRCRHCEKEFALLRRRHHCRQCGQVFCSDCLYKPPTATEVLEGKISPRVLELLMQKVCTRCAAVLLERSRAPRRIDEEQPLKQQQQHPPKDTTPPCELQQPRDPAEAAAPSLCTAAAAAPLQEVSSSPFRFTGPHEESADEKRIAYSVRGVDQYRRRGEQARTGVMAWVDGVLRAAVQRHDGKEQRFTEREGGMGGGSETHSLRSLFDNDPPRHGACGGGWWDVATSDPSSFVPAEWQAEVRAVYSDRVRYLCHLHRVRDAGLVRAIAHATWCAVRQTQVAWGGGTLRDHVDILDVEDSQTSAGAVARVQGIVLRQRVTSRRMPQHWAHRPRVLLLKGDVTVTSTASATSPPTSSSEQQLTEYMRSYSGQLDKLFQRIKVWSPQVIVVEKGMHHYLQKCITDDGHMSLLLKVGQANLEKLAAGCHARIVADLQYVGIAELQEPSLSPLGVCDSFRVVQGNEVTLCLFEGLPLPWFTALLVRGDHLATNRATVKTLLSESLRVAAHLVSEAQCLSCLHWSPPRVRDEGHLSATSFGSAQTTLSSTLTCDDDGDEGGGDDGSRTSPLSLPSMNLARLRHALREGEGGNGAPDTLVVQKVMYEGFGAHMAAAEDPEERRPQLSQPPLEAAAHPPLPPPLPPLPPVDSPLPSLETPTDRFPTAQAKSAVSTGPQSAPAASPTDAVHRPRRFQTLSFDLSSHESDQLLVGFLLHEATRTRGGGGAGRFLLAHGHRKVTVSHTCSPVVPNDADPRRRELLHKCLFPREVEEYAAASRAFARRRGSSALSTATGDAALFAVRGVAAYARCGASGPHQEKESEGLQACSPAALRLSFGAFLQVLFHSSPALCQVGSAGGETRLGTTFEVGFVLCHDVPPDKGDEQEGAPRQQLLSLICLEVTSIPIFRIVPPARSCVSDDGPPLPRPAAAPRQQQLLANAVSDVERDVLGLHSCIVQCLADLETGDGGSPNDPVADTPPETKKDPSPCAAPRGSPPDRAELSRLQVATANLAESLPSSVTSLRDADSIRWHRFRPLLQDLMVWLHANNVETPSHLQQLKDRQWVYSAARDAAADLGESSSLLCFALAESARTASGGSPQDQEARQVESGSRCEAATTARSTDSNWRESALKALHSPPEGECAGEAAATAAKPATLPKVTRDEVTDLCTMFGHPSCQVLVDTLFAEQFAALQQLYTRGHRASLIDSLRRCQVYKPQGGKTNSTFFLTADGKYLLKQVKTPELKHFPLWAPQYFSYMADYYGRDDGDEAAAWATQRTSFLAKTLGLYSVRVLPAPSRSDAAGSCAPQSNMRELAGHASPSSRNAPATAAEAPATPVHASPAGPTSATTTTTTTRDARAAVTMVDSGVQHFVLMENTAGHWDTVSRTREGTAAAQQPVLHSFDLKGSQRNRNAPQGSLVKLDVDFVKDYLHKGRLFFCSAASRRALMESLTRDAQLLRAAGVMDYSLFVTASYANCSSPGADGDKEREEGGADAHAVLNLSVIDYLHPFTGAKLLESRVKSGLDTVLGYSGRDPTIIDPGAYVDRFLRWMGYYFCEVPDADTVRSSPRASPL